MSSFEFTLRLNRPVTLDEVEALYEAGCGDAGIETGPGGTRIDFARVASSRAEAMASALRDVEKVPGLTVVLQLPPEIESVIGESRRHPERDVQPRPRRAVDAEERGYAEAAAGYEAEDAERRQIARRRHPREEMDDG